MDVNSAHNGPVIGRIIVLGRGGVGKTSCMAVFSGGEFASEYDPTLFDDVQVRIRSHFDTHTFSLEESGCQEESYYTLCRYQRGDGFFFIYSVADRDSFDYLPTLRNQVLAATGKNVIQSVLVGNKVDLAGPKVVTNEEAIQLATTWNCQWFEVSAKNADAPVHQLHLPFEYLATTVILAQARAEVTAAPSQTLRKCVLL